MHFSSSVTTAEVLAVFAEEISGQQGKVTDTFDDGRRLFTRSVLPHVEQVRSGDRVQGGVALKATEEGVWLYPYVFRLVCQNGAIMAAALESRAIVDLDLYEPEAALQLIREGVEACCAGEVFADNVSKMRTACTTEADVALTMLPLFSRFAALGHAELLSQAMDRFFKEGDRSQFGLANAITSVARDTQDPDLKWDLEEFGGGVAIGKTPKQPVDSARSARRRSRQLAPVG